jgi:hypothetical protein
MQTQAPMIRFRLPLFDVNGQKTGRCRGEKAYYRGNNEVDIEAMHIEWYAADPPNEVEMTVRSPQARISLLTSTAHGEGFLTVHNTGYTILGENWIWEGRNAEKNFSKVFIKKGADVTFFD